MVTRGLFMTGVYLGLTLLVGCSSAPSKFMSFAFRKPDANDPLANLPTEPSDSYKAARRRLDDGEETLLKFAHWREDMGDHVGAKEQYTNILAENPECVEARIGMARVEFATGRVTEAVEILQATARMYPDNAQTWVELGQIQSDRQEWGQAVVSLKKAVELTPENQAANYQLGLALARSERFEEAKSHLSFAVGESAALYNIGFVLHEAGRDQEAQTWIRRSLNAHPDQRTKTVATKMLAQMNGEAPLIAERRPGTVDVAQTSYEEFRETPGQNQALVQQQRPSAIATPLVQPSVTTEAVSSRTASVTVQPQTQFAPEARPPFSTQAQSAVPQYGVQPKGAPVGVPQWQGPTGMSGAANVQSLPRRNVQPQQWPGAPRF